jgi:hypothetical protein
MHGAKDFLDTVVGRERALAAWLFAATVPPPVGSRFPVPA